MSEKYLLTPDELKKIKIPYSEDDDIFSAVDRIVYCSIKAQDLKSRRLMKEWILGSCANPKHEQLDWDFHPPRYDCPECMAELEEELK